MEWFDIADKITPALRRGDLAACERETVKTLSRHAGSPFMLAADRQITNPLSEVAAYFDDFLARASQEIAVRAVYTEMIGFDIKSDRWFCDSAAYREHYGPKFGEWIWRADFVSERVLTITGLEDLQALYASPAADEPENEDAAGLASLLIVIKFQDVIRRAAPLMRHLKCPILATAHEYNFIYEHRDESR